MARLVHTLIADDDIDGILTDLAAKAGRHVADKYNGLFEALYDRLAAHPDIGARRPALGRNIRIGIVSPYIVIYRHAVENDTVTVLRLVHGRRRITGKLLPARP